MGTGSDGIEMEMEMEMKVVVPVALGLCAGAGMYMFRAARGKDLPRPMPARHGSHTNLCGIMKQNPYRFSSQLESCNRQSDQHICQALACTLGALPPWPPPIQHSGTACSSLCSQFYLLVLLFASFIRYIFLPPG